MFINKSMTSKVVKITEEETVYQAQEKMKKNDIRHLPVVNDDNVLIGIITDRDVRSALPPLGAEDIKAVAEKIKVKDIMTKDPVAVKAEDTIQDALLLVQKYKIGALPVVDNRKKVRGILSVRDLLRSFINVLGIKEPGTLLCIVVENELGNMKKIVDTLYEEKISVGSILVARFWEKNKRAVFPYLLTQNVINVKRRLRELGFELINPMDWNIDSNLTDIPD